ncbi:Gamma-aminobutyric acid type B receptor subunit 1, partial [Trichoplax sp. H2]
MKLNFTIFLLLHMSIDSCCKSDKIDLYLGGFFPIDNFEWNASGLLPVSQMAIDDINSRDDILPNYRLNLIVRDTKAVATLGVKILFDFIQLPPTKIMLLGSGFTRVTSAIAGVAKYFNLIQSTERLLSELHRAKIEVIAEEGLITGTNSSRQIKILKKSDARIIIAYLQEEDAIEVFCQAYKHQMYGPNYVWIIPNYFSNTFWSKATKFKYVDCTPEEIAISANYSLSISFAAINVVTNKTISGMGEQCLRNGEHISANDQHADLETPNNFNIRYNNWPTIVNQTYYPNSYAAFAYDSIWAEAMAMNNSIKRLAELNRTLEDFHYGDREMSRILKEEMYNLNFSGIS